MRSGRSNGTRAIALSLAAGMNASFLLVLVFSRESGQLAPEPGAMIWIIAAVEPRPEARKPSPADASRRAVTAGNLPTLPASPAAAGAITLLPESAPAAPTGSSHVDWYAEAEIAASSAMDNSGPPAPDPAGNPGGEIHVRPESFWIPPKAGTVEPAPGGGTRIWTSDLCYREYSVLEADPFTGRYRAGGRQVCKARNMADRLSEARAEAVADAVRRKRSKAPPVSRAPGTTATVP